MYRHFPSTRVFGKWSEPRTCAAAKRAEKVQEEFFGTLLIPHGCKEALC